MESLYPTVPPKISWSFESLTGQGAELVQVLDTHFIVNGRFGGALSLNGGYVEILNSPTLDMQNGMTAESWLKPKVGGNQTLVTKSDTEILSDPATFSFNFRLNNGAPEFRVSLDSNFTAFANSTGSLVSDIYQHSVGVFNGTHIAVAVDGDLQNVNVLEGQITDTSSPVRIGSIGSNSYRGLMDETRILNVARRISIVS
jgi:hypothetical protein